MTCSNIIAKHCKEDRERVFETGHGTWTRTCGLDLLAKILILYLNSMGSRTKQDALYVDEINNRNMHNNLQRTADSIACDHTAFLCFYYRKRGGHCKTGIGWSVFRILSTIARAIPIAFTHISNRDKTNLRMIELLVGEMQAYIKRCGDTSLYVLMSDHHFYSTIIAESCQNSIVLQHGLIQDIRFFTPVRASAICCWSKKSARLINSSKALVTGTLKFEIRQSAPLQKSREFSRVLVCLSSSKSSNEIQNRLAPILALATEYGFSILVKTHPGSLYSLDELKKATSAAKTQIELYKEERIEDIDFDFAFIEQSTAVLDIACLKIPFIICSGDCDTYFTEYDGVLPIAHNDIELIELYKSFSYPKWKKAVEYLLDREINGGRSSLLAFVQSRISAAGGVENA